MQLPQTQYTVKIHIHRYVTAENKPGPVTFCLNIDLNSYTQFSVMSKKLETKKKSLHVM